MTVVGKKFSVDFEQATEINGNTQILVQSEGQPVEKASVEQLGVALMDEDIIPNPDGSYPNMSVGFAENIVGDGSATEEEFSFRPTAGVNRNTLNDGAARIHTLKGRSVVWNQIFYVDADDYEKNGISVTKAGGNDIILNGTATAFTALSFGSDFHRKSNHYYLLGALEGVETTQDWYITDQNNGISYGGEVVIFNATTDVNTAILIRINEGVTFDNKLISIICIDLTQMFGAGNEPQTVEKYYQRKPILLNEEEYTEGKLVNLVPQAIKTTGFNQWDEQWRNGYYNATTGEFVANSSYVANVTPIKVLPKTKYYIAQPAPKVVVNLLDANGKMIDRLDMNQGTVFETNENTKYINFAYLSNSYNNDVCVSLYWPTEYGNLYGTYKPYKPFERDLSWVSKYFPNGMRSAGSAHDEIRFNSTKQRWETVQRVGVVDSGDYTVDYYDSTHKRFVILIPNAKPQVNTSSLPNAIMGSGYTPYSANTFNTNLSLDLSFSADNGRGIVYIRNLAYTDTASFKAALQSVKLNYELAEPIVTPITENINLDYDVSDYGTEELIVAEGVESAPLSASIEYSPNVLAMLKNAPDIADDVDALKSQVDALKSQVAALTALTATNNE